MPTITLSTGLRTRPAIHEDAQAIAAMNVEHELAVMGVSESTPDDVLEFWHDEEVDIVNDTLVITAEDEKFVGYAAVAATSRGIMLDANMGVIPAYRESSVASYLLQFAEERAYALLPNHPQTPGLLYAWAFMPDMTQLLEQHGFAVESSDYRMRIVFESPPPQPQVLEGITIRPYIAGKEERAVYDVIAGAFPDIDGKPYRPYEEWYENVFIKSSSFDPSMLYVAEADGSVVGTVNCRIRKWDESGDGFIWQVAVRRAWRKRGIALNLLYTAFCEYYRRGVREVLLDVYSTNTTGAQELYQRAGMYVRSKTDYMTKILPRRA